MSGTDTSNAGRSGPDAGGADTHRALASAVRVVSGVTLLSRLGGLVRDVLLVRVFGQTALASAFTAGFAIPNLFRRLFGEGALSAAFIPEYTGALKADPDHARRFASLVVGVLAVATGLLTAVIELGLLLVLVLAPPDADRDLSIKLIMVMLPFMPFICVTAILGGMLQVHGRFGPASSGPLVLNGFIIAVGLWHVLQSKVGDLTTAYALGIATVLSGLTQAAWFAILLRRNVRWTRDFTGARERAGRMLRKMVPVLIGMGTLQLNSLVDQLVAMWPIWVGPTMFGLVYPLQKDSNILINAAQRLYQFPLGVFGIAVATAAFPMLSRHADDAEKFGATLRRGLRLSLFIGLPASIGLMLVREDAMAVLFRFDSKGFTADGVERSGMVLLGHAAGIWAYSLNHVFTRAFYAKGDMTTPLRVSLAGVGLNFALNWTLIWPLHEAGLAWSTTIAAVFQTVALSWLCSRKLGAKVLDRETAAAAARLVVVSVVMGAGVWLVMWLMPRPQAWGGHAARLAAACAAGLVIYPAAALMVKAAELKWLVKRSVGERA